MEPEPSIKKYEELYKLSKEGLDEELSRFRRLDEKASRYFTVLSILLVALSLAGWFALDLFLPPSNILDWLCLSTAIPVFLCCLVALYFIFSVLRTQPLTKFPVDNELLQFFNKHRYLDILYALTRGNINAVAENRAITDRKTRRLTWGYRFIVVLIIFLLVFALAIVARTWIQKI